ncbi:plasmid replication protein, CyRepA1 family [Coleofasciculus sp. FACHB-501]|uniref:plasmid replication protein, CyRepA1 family n=1 Tax=Cyanophyceae TaxID=3028117 RepID=UPI00168839B7|nr:plasmid replication protein, CyRepA1 family [Coleofasciculus sp. FACHB-501]MBD1837220.1 ATP-binding protein [Coleofasciculus sp. FACHB-501]
MNTSFKALKGSCPVCSGARKDCRQSENLVHCRDSEANPPDYIFRGLDKLGFGMWVEKLQAEAASEEQREQWRQQRQLEREQRLQAEKEQRSQLLDEPSRDREIRKLLGQLDLSPQHRENLRQRGLSDEQIRAGMFRSVQQWQKLDTPVSHRLAGISITGQSLTNYSDGFLCPVWNPKGEIVAWQQRLNDAAEGKYRWASSATKKRPNGATSHLQNGELPVSVCRPSGEPSIKGVGLVEGILKPWVTAQLSKRVVLGAGGGNFASSPETFRAYLAQLEAEIDGQPLILFPDAGAIANKNVMRQYQQTYALLKKWGYELRIGWWGQLQKGQPDADELTNFDAIAYLTPEEFFELAEKEQYWQKVADAQKKLNTLTYPTNILLDCEYLPIDTLVQQLPSQGVIALKARKGGGKSTLIERLIAQYKGQNRPVVSITPRIALGREQAFKWDITWIDESGVAGNYTLTNQMRQHEETLALCWDSLWKILPKNLSRAVIIIDESELGFSHVATSSTCKEKRPFILDTFSKKIQEVLGSEGLVILSDADLTDVSVDYVKKLAPDAPVFTVVNVHKGKPWDVEFYTGKYGDVEDLIFQNLGHGIKTTVATDSQLEAEALERAALKWKPDAKIIRIDRKTTQEDWGRNFVKNANKSIETLQPDLLIYTPSMGVGVSITIEYFEEVFGLFFGSLEPSQCRQMLARVRQPVPRIVWAKDANHDISGCKSFLPEVVKRQLMKFHSETSINILDLAKNIAGEGAEDGEILEALNRLWNSETKTWDNPHIDLYAKLKARRNFGLSQLAVQLKQELEEEGHVLCCFEGNPTLFGNAIAGAKDELKDEESIAKSEAEDISLEDAQAIMGNSNSTEEDRHKADKAFLKNELPGVDLTPQFIRKAVIDDRRRWLNSVKLYWMLGNEDKTQELDRREWRHKLKQFSQGIAFIADIRTYSAQVKTLKDVGLLSLIDPERDYTATDADVQEFLQRAYFMRHRLYTALNVTVTSKTDAIDLINRLLKKVGLRLVCDRKSGDTRYYRLDQEQLLDPDRISVLDALSRKYAEIHNQQASELGHDAPIYLNKKAVMSNLDLKREIKRGEEAALPQSLVGRVLRAIRGFEKGATDWVVSQSGNFLKTAQGWHIALSEIGDWYELEEAIA